MLRRAQTVTAVRARTEGEKRLSKTYLSITNPRANHIIKTSTQRPYVHSPAPKCLCKQETKNINIIIKERKMFSTIRCQRMTATIKYIWIWKDGSKFENVLEFESFSYPERDICERVEIYVNTKVYGSWDYNTKTICNTFFFSEIISLLLSIICFEYFAEKFSPKKFSPRRSLQPVLPSKPRSPTHKISYAQFHTLHINGKKPCAGDLHFPFYVFNAAVFLLFRGKQTGTSRTNTFSPKAATQYKSICCHYSGIPWTRCGSVH